MAKSKTSTERKLDSYTSGMDLLRSEATAIFLCLADKTPTQVGYEFGLDRFYSTDASIRASVHKAFQMVLQDPESYDIPMAKAAEIQAIVSARALQITKDHALTVREKKELSNAEIPELVTEARDTAYRLINAKLDIIESSKTELKNAKLSDLVKAGDILFNKGQIVRGEATQNIAILSKVDKNMSAEDALTAIVQMQEMVAQEKELKDQKKK